MAVRTLSERLDNLYTTTWQNMKSTVADQIFDASPFWFWLRAHNGLDSVAGGRFITEPLRFAKSDNIKWFTRGGTLTLDDKEFLTIAKYDWRYLADSIVRFGIDEQQNRGKNQIIDLMRAKLDNSRDSLIDELESRLGGVAGTDQMNGLQDIVPDDPTVTASSLGGIDPSVDTWWQSQADSSGANLSSVAGQRLMLTLMNKCSNNLRQDAPGIIVSGQGPWEDYWEGTLAQKRISNKTLGDAGFQNVEFNGIPMIWTSKIADTRLYMLNVKFLKFKYDPMMFFDMTEWKPIPEQINDRAAQIALAGNLVTGRRRVHGVFSGLV